MTRVVLIANDVVPGFGLPVAAPGLRAFGLRHGLEAHGVEVLTALVAESLAAAGGAADAMPSGVDVVAQADLQSFAREHAPAVVVFSNSQHAPHLDRTDGLRFVFDGFAPQLLERAASIGRSDGLDALEERKLIALRLADGLWVNGEKKMEYYRGWVARADRDPASVPMALVEMCLPAPSPVPTAAQPRILIAGYLQRWSHPGPWLEVVLDAAARYGAAVDLAIAPHWGGKDPGDNAQLTAARAHPTVTEHAPMPYEDFMGLAGAASLSVDLFAHTSEREYAMVTRTVSSLVAGVPVVHPPFTEVSPLIEAEGAGWLVDAEDLSAVAEAVEQALTDEADRAKRAEGAVRLARSRFDPERALAAAIPSLHDLYGRAAGDLR